MSVLTVSSELLAAAVFELVDADSSVGVTCAVSVLVVSSELFVAVVSDVVVVLLTVVVDASAPESASATAAMIPLLLKVAPDTVSNIYILTLNNIR